MRSTGRIMLVALLLVALAVTVGAEQVESNYENGDLSISLGVGFGYGFSLALYPGVEYIITGVKIADVVPLQFGVAARGLFNWYNVALYDYGFLAFGGGVFGTAHLPLKAFDFTAEWLDRFDIYIGLGVSLTYFSFTGDWATYGVAGWNPLRFGFASLAGVSYFLSDRIAVYSEGLYWAYYGGGTLGIIFRI